MIGRRAVRHVIFMTQKERTNMRFSMIAGVGVFSLMSAVAFAGPVGPAQTPSNVPGGIEIHPYQCAPGFTKSNDNSTPAAVSWDCRTPVLTCPPPPHGLSGGLKSPSAISSDAGLDVMFTYSCSWTKPPG
jgi:hypothetical protein